VSPALIRPALERVQPRQSGCRTGEERELRRLAGHPRAFVVMSTRKLPTVRGGGIPSEHEQHRRKCRGGRVLARLVKSAVQEIATRFRLAEEQADQAGAEQRSEERRVGKGGRAERRD